MGSEHVDHAHTNLNVQKTCFVESDRSLGRRPEKRTGTDGGNKSPCKPRTIRAIDSCQQASPGKRTTQKFSDVFQCFLCPFLGAAGSRGGALVHGAWVGALNRVLKVIGGDHVWPFHGSVPSECVDVLLKRLSCFGSDRIRTCLLVSVSTKRVSRFNVPRRFGRCEHAVGVPWHEILGDVLCNVRVAVVIYHIFWRRIVRRVVEGCASAHFIAGASL